MSKALEAAGSTAPPEGPAPEFFPPHASHQIRRYQQNLQEADRQRSLRSQYSSALCFPLIFFLALSVGLSSFAMYHLQNGPKKVFSK